MTATCETETTTAEDVKSRLRSYEEFPARMRLHDLAETLAGTRDPAAAARDAGISPDWLAGQGELSAQASREDLDGSRWRGEQAARELFLLRRALTRLGVPCDRWAVPDSEIAAVLLECARSGYANAVQRMSPRSAWNVFVLWAEGAVPDLNAIADGAREVVLGYVIRHLRELLAEDSDWDGSTALKILRRLLPSLDDATIGVLRDGGIPVEPGELEQALLVCETRSYWMHWDGDTYHLFLETVCKRVLADKTVQAGEIGASEEAIWHEARTWTAERARQAAAGDYGNLTALAMFLDDSGLGCKPFGLDDGQIARWKHERALRLWAQARQGGGQAAFDVLCHCESETAWTRVTGLPETAARAELQAVMSGHASALKKRVEQAASPKWAEPPFHELRHFMSEVHMANTYFSRHGKPLIRLPWTPERDEWNRFCDRYLEDD